MQALSATSKPIPQIFTPHFNLSTIPYWERNHTPINQKPLPMKKMFYLTTLTFFILSNLSIVFAQTSYTWNGSSSTDFATAANWTPSGVPGSGDNITIVTTSNDPVLDGNRTVNNLTITTGILKLAGYNITVANSGTFNGGTIQNGKLIMTAGGVTFSGTTVDCKVDVKTRVWGVNNTVFKDSVRIEHNTGTDGGMGGNIFEAPAFLANSNGGYFRSGVGVADTFLAPVTFNAIGTGYVYVANSSAGNYFEDDVTLLLNSNGQGMYIGNHSSSSSYFNGDIIFNVTSGSGFINFNLGSNVHNGELLVGSSGYNSGLLTLKAYAQTGPTTVDLTDFTGSSQVSFGTGLVLEGDVVSPSVTTSISGNCHFKGEVSITKLGGWGSNNTFDKKADLTMITYNTYTGGNMFKDTTVINGASVSGYGQGLGYSAVDTFLAPVTINTLTSISYGFTLGNATGGTYFADDVTFNNFGASNTTIVIGGHASTTNHFVGDITLNADSSCGGISFNLGNNIHDGNLVLGGVGYNSGVLTMKSYTNTIGTPIDLSAMNHTSTLILGPSLTLEGSLNGPNKSTTLYANCRFKDDVTLPKLVGWSGYTTCEGKADLKMVQYNTYVGGNVYMDTTIITAASAQGYNQGISTTVADTFLAPVTIIMQGNQGLYVGYGSVGTYFADDVTFKNTAYGSSTIYVNAGATATSRFDGDIYVESSSGGGINFNNGTITHNGLLKVGPNGFNAGVLNLTKYTQTENGTIDLSTIGGSSSISVLSGADITADFNYSGSRPITLTGATFRGAVDIEQGSLPINNCKFFGTARLEKKAGSNNLNGGNTFHGVTTLENSSSGNYIYWGNSVADTFMTDLTLINLSSSPLWMNYGTTGYYGGDIIMSGTSGKIIRFGSSTAGRVAVFNGSSDQNLTVSTSGLDVQLYRAQVNKPGGRLKLNSDAKVDYELALTKGIIETTNGAILSLADNVLPTASDSSYVEGKVKKIGNDAFTFPVGRNGVYRPIGISAPGNVADAFTADYIFANSNWDYPHASKDSTISAISITEYWLLEKNSGSSNPAVTLSWDTTSTSCSFQDSTSLVITYFEANEWKSAGATQHHGDLGTGTIQTDSAVNDFIVFAFGLTDGSFSCTSVSYPAQKCGLSAPCNWQPVAPVGCDDIVSYTWDENDLDDHPIKFFRVNYHVMRRGNGTGNIANNQENINRILEMFSYPPESQQSINYWLENNGSPIPSEHPITQLTYPDPLTDPRIRFIITEDDIHFWNSDVGYLNDGGTCSSYCYDNFGLNKETHINIFSTGLGSGCGILPSFVVMQGTSFNFNTEPQFILHELGHVLGLCHTGSTVTGLCPSSDVDDLVDTHHPDVSGGWDYGPGTTWPNCAGGVTSNNFMGYNNTRRYFSPMQIGVMTRSILHEDELLAKMECYNDGNELYINQDETWEFGRLMGSDLIVTEGNHLTIKCIVAFPPEASLIVQDGARVTIDGGRLTSSCNNMWKGIQVQGVANQNQSTSVGGYQGIVELKNGAIIEHARVGIDVLNEGSNMASGGVVIAENSTIQNCRKAVAFGPFNKHDNISSFTNVNFLSNQPLNDPSYLGEGTTQFVTIWGAYGIDFTDCSFEFDYANAAFVSPVPLNRWPTGINSAFAGYRLKKGSGSGNQFLNLQNGLYGVSLWGMHDRISSAYSSFTNVYRNISLAGNGFPILHHNTHDLPEWDQAYQIPSYGFMGNMNLGYKLYENHYNQLSGAEANVGVILDGSSASDFFTINSGNVHHNYFTGVYVGTQTEENNLVAQISCNTYDGNGLDWAVNPQSDGYLADQGTMCPQILVDGERSGNTFQNPQGSFNLYEFSGNLQDQTTYYAAGGLVLENENTIPLPSGGNLYVQGGLVGCEMSVADASCDPEVIGPHEWDDRRRASQATWHGRMADLDSLEANIDSSQTQLLLDTIANLSTHDTVMRDLLVYHTPLSDTVLTSYIDRPSGKTAASFQTVLLQNLPASKAVWELLSSGFNDYKDEWIPLADTLQAAQRGNPGVTTATSLNREIRYHGGHTHQYADEVVLYWVESDDMDSAKAYMDTVGLYPLRLALLGTELSEGNWDEADSSLVKLPLVTTNDTAVYDLFEMMINLGRDTLTILDIGSADSLRVQQIAADTTLDAAVMAKGILNVLLDTMYFEMPEAIPGTPSGKRGQDEPEEETVQSPSEASYFKAYPNPFNQQVTIAYDLRDDCLTGCFIRLSDIRGRTIFEQPISTGNGPNSVTFDLGSYETGMYICSLYNNQRLLQTSRLIRME